MASDTTRAAHDAQVSVLRRLGPSERVRIAVEMSEDVRRIAVEAERRRHPELTAEQALWAVLRRSWSASKP